MKYVVITAHNLVTFGNEVNKYLASGWIPQGGLTMTSNNSGETIYGQSLVLGE